MIECRVEVAPRWPLRLPRRGAPDGVLSVRRGVVHRLLHAGDEPVVVRAAGAAGGSRVLLGACAADRAAAEWGMARMRFALGLDDDLAPFHRRFASDPMIGALVRADPTLRVRRRPLAWEALAWAVTEQLIEFERAAAIQRRIVARLGRRHAGTGLRDVPPATVVGRAAPASLAAMDLSGERAALLVRVAREVAAGRVALEGAALERGWRRLRAIPGIGPWTIDMLALHGQGRHDHLPAGDLAYLRLAGRLLSGGDPRARATEADVRALFAPYGEWAGLAGAYALRLGGDAFARHHRAAGRAAAAAA